MTSRRRLALASVLAALIGQAIVGSSPAEEPGRVERERDELKDRIESLRKKGAAEWKGGRDWTADAEVFVKGAVWGLMDGSTLSVDDRKLVSTALDRGRARVASLENGQAPWASRKGKVVRGFVSAVDGSVQPYAVVVPGSYNPDKPTRLDVVLHGSTRPVGTSELQFMSRFDDGDDPAESAPDRDYIELHPLGRVENGYRWAGETDVFEAIAAARRNYNIDGDRIVLRGMSMGASGTWHLGLKHPDRFVALGPYCGYVDTHEFSKTPIPSFVPVGPLPPNQEKTLHILDSVDYAANAGMVPVVACMGDEDVFFQAHEIMGRAMAKEGLALVNLISPGTGHVVDPVTHAEQMKRIGTFAAKGIDHLPNRVRFVTWSLKYSRCLWLQVLGMDEHYARAELDARIDASGNLDVDEPRNVARFAVLPPAASKAKAVRIGGRDVALLKRAADAPNPGLVFANRDGRWVCLGEFGRVELDGKRPGLQGPIDDAFTAPFLCVRGTGKAWDPAVGAWAEAALKRFSREWRRYFRGDLPVKDDTEVTEEDARRFNLILFGDPGGNAWIARVLPKLPVRWTHTECAIGEVRTPSDGHAPVFIQPNPRAPDRYVVVNSGHTFHKKELSTLNYLLFPRLGDWAVVRVPDRLDDDPSRPLGEEIIGTGFFDEQWRPSP